MEKKMHIEIMQKWAIFENVQEKTQDKKSRSRQSQKHGLPKTRP